MKTFNVVRIYSDPSGESHFAEFAIPLTDSGQIGALSEAFAVKAVIFREVEPTYDFDFHVAPQQQYIVLLEGAIEIETSGGEKGIFRAGDILYMEDTTGKGHRTRNIQQMARKSIFILV